MLISIFYKSLAILVFKDLIVLEFSNFGKSDVISTTNYIPAASGLSESAA